MNEIDPQMVRELHRLTKENNTMLHKLHRDSKRARFWRNLKLIITLGLLFGAYYFVQPLIENLTNAYGSIQQSFEDIQTTRNDFSNVSSLLNGLKKDSE